MHEISAILEV